RAVGRHERTPPSAVTAWSLKIWPLYTEPRITPDDGGDATRERGGGRAKAYFRQSSHPTKEEKRVHIQNIPLKQVPQDPKEECVFEPKQRKQRAQCINRGHQ